jgi:hypothetical protein
MPIENWRPPDFLSEAQVKKTAKSSKAIRADNLCQQDSVFAARDRFLEEPGLMSAIVSVPGFQSGFGSPFLPCISAPSNWSTIATSITPIIGIIEPDRRDRSDRWLVTSASRRPAARQRSQPPLRMLILNFPSIKKAQPDFAKTHFE